MYGQAVGKFVGNVMLYKCQLTFLFFVCKETEQVFCCLLKQHMIVPLKRAIWIMVILQLPQPVDYNNK